LEELHDLTDPERVLRDWKLEALTEGEWKTVFPDSELSPILSALLGRGTTQVLGEFWEGSFEAVKEAIEDNTDPHPELEFTTNAIEHVRRSNLRFAVLESVIGLEIVLARFLASYMKFRKGIPKSRIRAFLSPELGLTARVGGLLDLVLTADQMKKFSLDRVLSTIKLRNSIVHRTGRLLQGVPADTVREGINSVVGLTTLLAAEAETIEAEPEMKGIADELALRIRDLPRPSVKYLGSHDIGVWVRKVTAEPVWVPDNTLIKQIVDVVIELRGPQDKRFDAHHHLKIGFEAVPWNKVVRWRDGQLEQPS